MTRIVAIRPRPGLSDTVEAGAAMGLAIEGYPLAEVHPVAWHSADLAFDALLFGSANAVRHGGPALARWRGRTAHVVGEATAEAARDAGLLVGTTGKGGLQQVVDELAAEAPLALLRLAGEKRTELRVPDGLSVATRTVYRVEYRAMPDGLATVLRGDCIVLLHSGEAARHFADECDRLGIARGGVGLAALAPRIADAAGGGWRLVETAAQPLDSALLALARDLCH